MSVSVVRQFLVPALCLALAGCGQPPEKSDTLTPTPTGPDFVVDVVYEGLDLPTSLNFTPGGTLLILERGFSRGKVTRPAAIAELNLTTRALKTLENPIAVTSHYDDVSGNQGGAVGMALHPQFATNHSVFVCYHYSRGATLENRLSRFEIASGRLEREKVLVDRLPGDAIHNGCRVAIDAQGLLYLSTGSIEPFDDALDLKRLSGKILRITETGAVPAGNPYPGSPVWSYGHRNAQGLAFDRDGTLWSTEHGESSADELNRIEPGANYGFSKCRGSAKIGETFLVEEYWRDRLKIVDGRATCQLPEPHAARYRPAVRTYFPELTVGISDLVVYDGQAFPSWKGNLLITMLKAERLVRVVVADGSFVEEQVLIDGGYGRLRDIAIGPDGFLYVLTNQPGPDGNWRGHSRLLRLRPSPANPAR